MTQPPYPPDPYQDPHRSGYGYSGQQPYEQQPMPGAYGPPYVPVGRPPMSGSAVASLVLGILAVLFCWILFIGVIAWPLLIIGGVLGIAAFGRTRTGEADGHGLAVAGVVCCGVALAVCLFYLVPFLLVAAFA